MSIVHPDLLKDAIRHFFLPDLMHKIRVGVHPLLFADVPNQAIERARYFTITRQTSVLMLLTDLIPLTGL